ncbi:MAG: hypothetical protein ACD_11C00054G0021 [uncultured bacterium]|nr:MAG: hypothetical protein ACD_11C00054G0021 [uncultured bacterium]HBR72095.1 hypothetical protein [Candidatus Moranbacteria bacterium]
MRYLINTVYAGIISDAPTFSQIGMNVLQFLLSVFSVLAIIMLLISGALYFFSAGDPRKIGLAKKSAVYSVVGVIVTLSALILVRFIGNFFV